MILLSRIPFDAAQLRGEYPAGSVQQQVLDTMAASEHSYAFPSIATLKFELQLRDAIVQSAMDLHKSGLRFAVFEKSEANEAYWDRTENGGFRLKPDVSPSAAINDIFTHGSLYATECATGMAIVYYKAVLTVFGDQAFDTLFPNIYLMSWQINDPLLREIANMYPAGDVLLGDRQYFDNPQVDPDHTEWQGENVIVLPDGLYYGHGVGIRTGDEIIRLLNNSRKEDATQSAFLDKRVGRPNFTKMARAYYTTVDQSAVLVWKAFAAQRSVG